MQWGGSIIKAGKLQSEPGCMTGLNPGLGTCLEKSLNSLMPKALDHVITVTRKLTAYKRKYAPCNLTLKRILPVDIPVD